MLVFHFTVANLKIIVRDRQTLFWALAFPLLLMLTMGLMMRVATPSAKVGVADNARDPLSTRLVAQLGDDESVEVFELQDEASGRYEAAEGEIDILLVIPPGLDEAAAAGDPAILLLVPGAGGVFSYSLSGVTGIIGNVIERENLRIAGAEGRLLLETEAATAKSTDFLDFLVPGMAVWGIMSYSVFGIATSLAMYRDRQVLRRMQATPLKVRTFFAGQVIASLMVAVVQGALILAAGKVAFGVNVEGNLLYLLVIILLGNLVFLNIGFIIGSISRTPQAASGIGNAIVLPLAFFSGAFFPTGNLPDIVRTSVGLMPLAPVVDAVRGVAVEAGTLADYTTELGLIGAWIAITAALAVRLFRFE